MKVKPLIQKNTIADNSTTNKKLEQQIGAKAKKVNVRKFIKRNRPKSSYGLYSKTITGQVSSEVLGSSNENKVENCVLKRSINC